MKSHKKLAYKEKTLKLEGIPGFVVLLYLISGSYGEIKLFCCEALSRQGFMRTINGFYQKCDTLHIKRSKL